MQHSLASGNLHRGLFLVFSLPGNNGLRGQSAVSKHFNSALFYFLILQAAYVVLTTPSVEMGLDAAAV